MCFSATASFAGAAVVGAIGAASLFRVMTPSHLFLALIPCIFALQQVSEALIWLGFDGTIPFIPYGEVAKGLYLWIAFFLWPIWIPLAFYTVEEDRIRKSLLLLILTAGVLLGFFCLYKGIFQHIDVAILGHSLLYLGDLPNVSLFYLPIVALPGFISSWRSAWIFSLGILISAFLAHYFFEKTFVSVWCFFGAVVGMLLYKVLRDNT